MAEVDDDSSVVVVEEAVEELFLSDFSSSNNAESSSILMVPSWLVSKAEKISLNDDSESSEEAEEDSLGGGGGGIPPGGGGGIDPSLPCGGSGGFMFLSAAISSSVLILPLLSVSRREKISLADELDELADVNSDELIDPSPSLSKSLIICAAISSKLGFDILEAEAEEVYDAYEL